MTNSRAIFVASVTALLTSCTVGPDFVRPEPPVDKQYLRGNPVTQTHLGAGVVQRFSDGAHVPENWWRLFNSSSMDPIVDEALKENPTLQAAIATLRQSREGVEAGEGVFYPQVNASFGAAREESNPASFGVNVPPSVFNLFTLTGSISYALDIFGGNRRQLEALRAQEDYEHCAVLAAYLTLTGNLVNAVIARSAYQAELDAIQKVIAAEEKQIQLTRTNVRSGIAAESALLTLKSQIAATRASLPPLAQKLDQTDHLLAILSGKTPSEWTPPRISFAELRLPEKLPKSLPSVLVRQRPDILESEALLHVASANVGVATAALYPSFTLSASPGLINTSAGNLLSRSSSLWNLGANVTAPLFHGGALRAQKRAAVEAFYAALATYRQTVLAGIQQVADALRALGNDADLVQAQTESVTSAQAALELLQASYQSGTASYLQLLIANVQFLQARIGVIQAKAQRLQDTVALFVALGGDWSATEPVLNKKSS